MKMAHAASIKLQKVHTITGAEDKIFNIKL